MSDSPTPRGDAASPDDAANVAARQAGTDASVGGGATAATESVDAGTSDVTSGDATGGATTADATTGDTKAAPGRRRARTGADDAGNADDAATKGTTKQRSTARTWLDRLILVVVVWAIWAFITTFVVQPFRIPSGSMENTLQVGDRIVVAKWAPRFSDVKRGDIVVFKDPGDWTDPVPSSNAIVSAIRKVAEVTHLSASGSHLVKRVVGVGGDNVSCDGPGKKLTVNGVAVDEPYLKTGVDPCQDKFSITVPKDKVWVMGDNRSNSADSRYHDDGTGSLGSVPISDITGRSLAVVWPIGNISGGHNDEDAFSKVPAAK